eukprot:CAMPEP_0202916222 /NCGR_PEP_ID=MMETSP1392-20130828/67994_1 /ASSEMBLY_ACC=CAM_ASM_000868 /TAXON_ID=225041 /ORGANISM="Chlamydomonas chlamydogama, Strain SAG 11-48b" /LENGTH=48 /DNA_ID= /DNA_START= /DNA_END= /DNA_ORIENTATION=
MWSSRGYQAPEMVCSLLVWKWNWMGVARAHLTAEGGGPVRKVSNLVST